MLSAWNARREKSSAKTATGLPAVSLSNRQSLGLRASSITRAFGRVRSLLLKKQVDTPHTELTES
jgi:hypothetical protein